MPYMNTQETIAILVSFENVVEDIFSPIRHYFATLERYRSIIASNGSRVRVQSKGRIF